MWLMPLGGYNGADWPNRRDSLLGPEGAERCPPKWAASGFAARPCGWARCSLRRWGRLPARGDIHRTGEHLVKMVKAAPTALRFDEVLVACDPEWRMEAELLRDSLPIADGELGHAHNRRRPACSGARSLSGTDRPLWRRLASRVCGRTAALEAVKQRGHGSARNLKAPEMIQQPALNPYEVSSS